MPSPLITAWRQKGWGVEPKNQPLLADLYSRSEASTKLAIRLFLKKTKRFNHPLKPNARRQIRDAPAECLLYLGLGPRNMGEKREEKATQSTEVAGTSESSLFAKPVIYECCYCNKYFLHKLPLRKHMGLHIKQIYKKMKVDKKQKKKAPKQKKKLIDSKKKKETKLLSLPNRI